MKENGPRRSGSVARQHTIYCSAEERAAIGRRARAAGMKFSPFVVACALRAGERAEAGEAPRLVWSEAEQRALHERVALLERCNRALIERLPGLELSALGALAFLVEAARARLGDEGRGRE